MAPSIKLQKTIAYGPKASAVLSLIGSGYIVYDCIRKLRIEAKSTYPKPVSTYYRFMTCISVGDIFFSTACFFGTWAMPSDTPYAWGAVGTVGTCSLSGFFIQTGIVGMVYNAGLALYYLFHVGWNWPCARIHKAERCMHVICLTYWVVAETLALSLGLFNNHGFVCYISAKPRDCKETWRYGDEADCERGDNATLFYLMLGFLPWVSVIILVAIIMMVLYRAVRQNEKKAERYSLSRALSRVSSSSTNGSPGRRVSRRLASQAYCYVGALIVTVITSKIFRSIKFFTNQVPDGAITAIAITIPIQGFLNVLVYLRPRYLKLRRDKQQSGQRSVVEAMSQAMREGDLEEEDCEEDCTTKKQTSPTESDAAEQPGT